MLLDKTEEQKITAQNVRWFLGVLLMKSGKELVPSPLGKGWGEVKDT